MTKQYNLSSFWVYLLTVIFAFVPFSLGAREIEPPDVFVRITLLQDELDLIRYVMGKPKVYAPEITVSNAIPFEVYSQARSLFDLADRLSFEHTQTRSAIPEYPEGEIQSAHVIVTIDAALEQVRRIKEKYDITEKSKKT